MESTIEFNFKDDGKKGRFTAHEGSKIAGDMHFTWAGPNKLIIDHTEVSPDFAGRGIGKLLLMEVVKMAREKKIKILPLCPFAKSVFEKTPEINDTLF